MSAWGFVFLAYGIVWSVILVYLLRLRGRYRRIQAELALTRRGAEQGSLGEKI